jgi:Domain of unknown function (DUF5615)
MPPRYYLDEDGSHRIAPLVRAPGYDVLATRDADRNGTPDDEQLRFATAEGRVLVTRNYDDFMDLTKLYAAEGWEHAGILFVPFSLPNAAIARIAAAIIAHAREFPDGLPPNMTDWLRSVRR